MSKQVMRPPSHLQRNWSCAPGSAAHCSRGERAACHDGINMDKRSGLTWPYSGYTWLYMDLNGFTAALHESTLYTAVYGILELIMSYPARTPFMWLGDIPDIPNKSSLFHQNHRRNTAWCQSSLRPTSMFG